MQILGQEMQNDIFGIHGARLISKSSPYMTQQYFNDALWE